MDTNTTNDKNDIDNTLKELARKENREKQRAFYNKMVRMGYKRRITWLSERSQELLDELSNTYTKEMVIEEALEVLLLVKQKLPDSKFCDQHILSKIKARMIAIPRDNPYHFDEVELIIQKRIAKLSKLLRLN